MFFVLFTSHLHSFAFHLIFSLNLLLPPLITFFFFAIFCLFSFSFSSFLLLLVFLLPLLLISLPCSPSSLSPSSSSSPSSFSSSYSSLFFLNIFQHTITTFSFFYPPCSDISLLLPLLPFFLMGRESKLFRS